MVRYLTPNQSPNLCRSKLRGFFRPQNVSRKKQKVMCPGEKNFCTRVYVPAVACRIIIIYWSLVLERPFALRSILECVVATAVNLQSSMIAAKRSVLYCTLLSYQSLLGSCSHDPSQTNYERPSKRKVGGAMGSPLSATCGLQTSSRQLQRTTEVQRKSATRELGRYTTKNQETMSENRRNQLNSIGFTWKILEANIWGVRFQQLVEYKRVQMKTVVCLLVDVIHVGRRNNNFELY